MAKSKKESIYLGVAVPHMIQSKNSANCSETASRLKSLVERGSKGTYCQWNLPAGMLKVGTLDNLVGLSDDMGKFDASLRNCCVQIKKIYETYGGKPETLVVSQKPVAQYLGMFEWNNKWNTNNALKKIINDMTVESRTNLNNLIKIKAACVDCTRKLGALNKQTEGNLTVRDFEHKLAKEVVIDTETFKSLFVVVPKGRAESFKDNYAKLNTCKEGKRMIAMLEEYEEMKEKQEAEEKGAVKAAPQSTLMSQRIEAARAFKEVTKQCQVVVPTSAVQVDQDDEFIMFRVVVIRKAAGACEQIYKEQRYTLRALSEDWMKPKKNDAQKEKEKVDKDLKKHKKRLIAVCKAFYSSSFEAWTHLKAIRLFVEAVLRYGLPVAYTFSLIQTGKGGTKTIHDRLTKQFSKLGSTAMEQKGKKKKGKKEVDFTGLQENYKPYVFTEMVLP